MLRIKETAGHCIICTMISSDGNQPHWGGGKQLGSQRKDARSNHLWETTQFKKICCSDFSERHQPICKIVFHKKCDICVPQIPTCQPLAILIQQMQIYQQYLSNFLNSNDFPQLTKAKSKGVKVHWKFPIKCWKVVCRVPPTTNFSTSQHQLFK